jgi:hypothetical protein
MRSPVSVVLDSPWARFGLGIAIGYELAHRNGAAKPAQPARREGIMRAVTRVVFVAIAESIVRRALVHA